MATRQLLNDLLERYSAQTGVAVAMEAVGGVDAAKRVQAGEVFDLVVLASDAIDKLAAAGHLLAASKVDLVQSGVSVAVQTGAAAPDIGSADAVRQAVLAARSVSYSTGPSGVALLQLFQRWGIVEALQGRLVQAPVGVPVASLVARGDAELGFQQLSELLHAPGIQVLGPLPPEIQITTTFSAATGSHSSQAAAVQVLMAFLGSAATADVKRRHGMAPA